mmetsp:Transcript_26268/g.31768  ORF Transcript_26268/g.31768 Transcript_26268/m.31768 type:complete len:378 (-) Transcript_26268:186-1319(-)
MTQDKLSNTNHQGRQESEKNDDSNPQQGNNTSKTQNKESGQTRSTFVKVPPTKRDSRKLFVGGLPSNITGSDFRDIFEVHGTVIDSVVMVDRDNGRSRGFGFVTFEDKSVAENLLGGSESRSNTINIRGKICEVKAAEPKQVSSNSFRQRNKTSDFQSNNESIRDNSAQSDIKPNDDHSLASNDRYHNNSQALSEMNSMAGVRSGLSETAYATTGDIEGIANNYNGDFVHNDQVVPMQPIFPHNVYPHHVMGMQYPNVPMYPTPRIYTPNYHEAPGGNPYMNNPHAPVYYPYRPPAPLSYSEYYNAPYYSQVQVHHDQHPVYLNTPNMTAHPMMGPYMMYHNVPPHVPPDHVPGDGSSHNIEGPDEGDDEKDVSEEE